MSRPTGWCGRLTRSARPRSSPPDCWPIALPFAPACARFAATRAGAWRRSTWRGAFFFGISAVASFIVPSKGSILDLAAANWATALGGLCFLIGSLMLLSPDSGDAAAGGGT